MTKQELLDYLSENWVMVRNSKTCFEHKKVGLGPIFGRIMWAYRLKIILSILPTEEIIILICFLFIKENLLLWRNFHE